jgi:hypothetical protein
MALSALLAELLPRRPLQSKFPDIEILEKD